MLRSTPKVSSGERMAAATRTPACRRGAPPRAWPRTSAGSLLIAVRVAGIERASARSAAPIAVWSSAICPVSSPVAARKLAFSCRRPLLAVAQVIELGRRAPARAQADQHRQAEQAGHRHQRRPQAQREPTDHAGGAVRDHDGVAGGRHATKKPSDSTTRIAADTKKARAKMRPGRANGSCGSRRSSCPRNCSASAIWLSRQSRSTRSRSAIVRATRSTRSWARALQLRAARRPARAAAARLAGQRAVRARSAPPASAPFNADAGPRSRVARAACSVTGRGHPFAHRAASIRRGSTPLSSASGERRHVRA